MNKVYDNIFEHSFWIYQLTKLTPSFDMTNFKFKKNILMNDDFEWDFFDRLKWVKRYCRILGKQFHSTAIRPVLIKCVCLNQIKSVEWRYKLEKTFGVTWHQNYNNPKNWLKIARSVAILVNYSESFFWLVVFRQTNILGLTNIQYCCSVVLAISAELSFLCNILLFLLSLCLNLKRKPDVMLLSYTLRSVCGQVKYKALSFNILSLFYLFCKIENCKWMHFYIFNIPVYCEKYLVMRETFLSIIDARHLFSHCSLVSASVFSALNFHDS